MKTTVRKLVALALALAMLLTIMPASVFAAPEGQEASQGEPVAITAQPQGITAASGTKAEFAVEAAGDGLTYRWQYATKTGAAWYNAITAIGGYTGSTVKIQATAGRDGYQYRCVITDQYGNEAISEAAVLAVEKAEITAQPESLSAPRNSTAAFTVGVSGAVKSYLWQYNSGKTAKWYNLNAATQGYNKATMTLKAAAGRNGYSYRCVVTLSDGSKLTSDAATLNVVNYPVIAEDLKVDDYMTVAIDAEEGAFPEGTVVSAEKVEVEDVQKAVDEAEEVSGKVFYAVDITFTKDGEELQPAEGKTVKVRFRSQSLKKAPEDTAVVHIDGETNKAETVETVEAENDDEIAFNGSKFSIYALVEPGEIEKEARVFVSFYNPYKEATAESDLITTVYLKNKDCEGEDADETIKMTVYDPGLGKDPIDEDKYGETTFAGWEAFVADGHTATTLDPLPEGLKSIVEIRDWLKAYSAPDDDEAGFKEGQTIDFRVVLNRVYHINYFERHYDEQPDVVIGSQTEAVRIGEDGTSGSVEHRVSWPYIVVQENQDYIENFKGWKVKAGYNNLVSVKRKESDADDAPYVAVPLSAGMIIQNDDIIEIKGDIDLEPYITAGNWLTFEEVLPGAPYTAPQFLERGESAKMPSEDRMKRLGYNFDGWYKQYDEATGTYSQPYNGEPIEGALTVYAKWNAEERAPYTVIVWKRNLDSAGNPVPETITVDGETKKNPAAYSYSESIRLWGEVGVTVASLNSLRIQDYNDADYLVYNGEDEAGTGTISGNRQVTHTGTTGTHTYTNENYIGFNCKSIEDGVTINPEGNTIVNVYYDRIIYTVRIYHARAQNGNYNVMTTRSSNSNPLSLNNMNWTGTINFHQNADETWAANYLCSDTDIQTETSGGYTYYYTTITAAYGADISAQWPRYEQYPNLDNNDQHGTHYTFVSWYMQNTAAGYRGSGSGLDTFKGVINVMDEKILGDVTSAAPANNYLYGRYDDRTINIYTYQIWQEALLDDEGHAIIPEGKQSTVGTDSKTYFLQETMQANSNANPDGTQAPDYIGFDHIESMDVKPALVNNRSTIQFYYHRILNKIVYRDGAYYSPDNYYLVKYPAMGQANETRDVNIPYGDDMSAYNKGGSKYYSDYPSSYAGFVFEGWYIDETCTVPYTFTVMQEDDITVYAKFRQMEYRVYLHPQAGEGTSADPTLDYGTENPTMCFKVTDGEKVSTLNPTRSAYRLVGWFTDEGLSDWWDGDVYKLTETTVTTPYDYNAEDVYTDLYDKYGQMVRNQNVTGEDGSVIGQTPFNKDKYYDRFWVQRRLDLYAKWSSTTLGAYGINVEYDADEGYFGDDTTAKIFVDPLFYIDRAGATAQFAPTAPDGKVFLHWEIQKYENSEYVDAGEKDTYPGENFNVIVEYAKVEELEGHTAENPKLKYTIRLKAVYGVAEVETPTHITFYANNGKTMTVTRDGEVVPEQFGYPELQINKAVPILAADYFKRTDEASGEDYIFLGWAKIPESSPGVLGHDPINDPDGLDIDDVWLHWDGTNFHEDTPTGRVVNYVAADEVNEYDDLYAVWAPYFRVVYSSKPGTTIQILRTENDKTYNLVEATRASELPGVASDCYYGGYYTALPGADGSWSWDNAYKAADSAAIGTKLLPGAFKTYYVKEVPKSLNHLRTIYRYTYRLNTNALTWFCVISSVDDKNYTDAGYIVSDENVGRSGLKKNIKVQNGMGNIPATDPNTYVDRTNFGVSSPENDARLAYYIFPSVPQSKSVTVKAYWITPDGYTVYGPTKTYTFDSLPSTNIVVAETQ